MFMCEWRTSEFVGAAKTVKEIKHTALLINIFLRKDTIWAAILEVDESYPSGYNVDIGYVEADKLRVYPVKGTAP